MEINNNIVLYRYKKCVKEYCPVLEDLFSFILKIFAGNVLISCETNDDITQCQIRSSDGLNALLVYQNNVFHVHYMGTCENYLRKLISGKSSFNVRLNATEIALIGNQHHEGSRCGCLMNNILNDMFCIILDIIKGTSLFTSQTHSNSREYNVLASSDRPSLFFVHSDCVPDKTTKEQTKSEKVLIVKSPEMSRGVEKQYHKTSLPDSSHLSHLHSDEELCIGDRPYTCKYCGKPCRCLSELKSHERIHTGEKPFKCQYCERTFSAPSHVKRHERVHTGEKPFKCNYCEKTFSASSNLKNHERTHTGEKPYKCKFCGNFFRCPTSLKNHERTHTGERPYKCKFCIKTFATVFAVKCHERLHTGERPYKCTYCEKTFSFSADVKSHERIHTGQRPYKCKFCEKQFGHSFYLKIHMKTHNELQTSNLPISCSH